MNEEIERKWIVSEFIRREIEYADQNPLVIRQRYLTENIRVRLASGPHGDFSCITIKHDVSDLTRKEFEFEIPTETGNELLEFVDSLGDFDLNQQKYIEKCRFTLNDGFVLDIFNGKLKGLFIVEKEYNSEEAANESLPAWMEQHVVSEVTANKQYRNSNLVNKQFLNNKLIDILLS